MHFLLSQVIFEFWLLFDERFRGDSELVFILFRLDLSRKVTNELVILPVGVNLCAEKDQSPKNQLIFDSFCKI